MDNTDCTVTDIVGYHPALAFLLIGVLGYQERSHHRVYKIFSPVCKPHSSRGSSGPYKSHFTLNCVN